MTNHPWGVVLLTWYIFVCATVDCRKKISTALREIRYTMSPTTDFWLSHLRRS